MDTRSRPQLIDDRDGLEGGIAVRPHPSFGPGSLRSRKRLLAGGALACLVLAALYLGLRPATYTATSQLLVYIRQILTGPDQAILPGRADLPMVQNQIELLRSGNVLAKVVEALDLAEDPEFAGEARLPAGGSASRAALGALGARLAVRQIGTSHVIAVSFRASDPAKAARIVNTVVRIYLQELARASDAASSRAPTLREIYQSLGPSAQVIAAAEPPVRKDGPPPALILAAAALFGLAAAAGLALLLDALDDTIRSRNQMEYVLGLECLGVVPRVPESGDGAGDAAARRLLAAKHPALRRALALIRERSAGGLRTVGLTSALPGEGATTLAIGLAQAAAATGWRVLLVDAVPDDPALSRRVASLVQEPPAPGAPPGAGALDGLVAVRPGLDVLPLAERRGGTDRLAPRGQRQ
ncbi:Wzz/FepE/Etk N-terminal domain-containing protein, partial [Bosea minatitlanensis]|uniref:Wzz/FepE/Etk N-terminal domain-containing protein n=1 Tax=Bosea minatitlanensis TaxID=128782 RepID=UPI0035D4E9DD|nr:hypothetical protein [Bosea minatitlanensis]